jgi:uncharacterized membrane protein YphA (DoxX/SURF4 family)/thiol-disulfide isomerase/thioredoxin
VEPLLLTLRCLLALVFAVAGVTKLLDLPGSRRALGEFGVPAGLTTFGAVAVPAVELACAAALVIGRSARYGAVAALLLLTAFIAGILRANAHGRMPDCHCFGQLQSEPAGPSTVVRNGILAGIAVTIIAAGPWTSVSHGFNDLTGPQIAMVVLAPLAILLSLIAAHLWGKSRRLERELAEARAAGHPVGLPLGAPAPEFDLAPLRGVAGTLQDLLADRRPVVLVFVSASCGPCLEMLPEIGEWQASLAHALTLPVIFTGQRDEILGLAGGARLSLALAQQANEVFELYRLRATPAAVLVQPDGTIGSAAVEGSPAIEALIRSVIAKHRQSSLVVQRA